MIPKIYIHCNNTIIYFQYHWLIFNIVQYLIFHCFKACKNEPREHPYQRIPGPKSHDCFKSYLSNAAPIVFNIPFMNSLSNPSLVDNIIHSPPESQIIAAKMYPNLASLIYEYNVQKITWKVKWNSNPC